MVRDAVKWLFAVPEEPRPWWKVITWWEIRRIPYNLICGGVGFISLLLFFHFINVVGELKPGEDAIEPMALFAAPFLINIAYTAGWVAELFLRFVWRDNIARLGPALLKLGFSFSLFVILLPSVFWFLMWVYRSVTH